MFFDRNNHRVKGCIFIVMRDKPHRTRGIRDAGKPYQVPIKAILRKTVFRNFKAIEEFGVIIVSSEIIIHRHQSIGGGY
ncbi:hypothetical protein [Sphingorhabdus sp.]|uniref:hypothetical protein n=1 Tax=Sphingorhabdus sp. TaxID=1902408 RepID=UPI0035942536